ncbi:multidrug effflux MFS transporter [Stappia sp.]|uniref:multidrug effflux MFS transporter n=1 Tax=Stappia sp. TaxID=1870903 RepID=UPI0032D958A2
MTSDTSSAPERLHRLGPVEFVALIGALMALNAFAIDIMLPALGDIGAALNVPDDNDRQKVVLVYLFGFGAAQLIYGPLSDRYGRRPVLLGGLALYAAAGVVSVMATTMDQLLLARLLQGIGCAAPRVVAISIVRDCYAGERMGRILSLTMMVFMTVPIIAPSIGQLVLFVASWRAVFLLLTLGGLVMLVWSALRLGETLPPAARRPFAPGALLAAYRRTLTTRIAIGYMCATGVIIGVLFAFVAAAQQIFTETFDLGPAFPVVLAISGASLAVASYLNARLLARFGLRRLSHGALIAFVVIGALQVLAALLAPQSVVLFTALTAAMMFSFGFVGPSFNALALEPLGDIAGTASSMLGFITTAGGAVIGFVVAQTYDGTVLPIAIGFAVLALTALAIVAITEGGRLFRFSAAPG